MTLPLTAEDEEQLALDIAARTVTEIEAAEARMAQARKHLDQLMLDILPELTTDEERAEMWRRTGHVCLYLRAVEAGECEAADKYWTAMQEIQRYSRRPPYIAAHVEAGRILAFTEAWVEEAMPDLEPEEHDHVVQALLAEGRIRAAAEVWVGQYLPELDDDERAEVVRNAAAPPEAPDTTHDWHRPA